MKKTSPTKDHTASHLGNTTIFFLLAAPAVIILYASFVFNPTNMSHPVLYAIQVIADFIGMLAVVGLWLTILTDIIVPEHHRSHSIAKNKQIKSYKNIDILITVAGEPVQVVKETAMAAQRVHHVSSVYILDDRDSDEIQNLAQDLDCQYLRRDTNKHAKAGNVNNGLSHSKAEYFAILDADQKPKQNFISKLMPYFSDPNLAMVQTPQQYTNTNSLIASGANEAQSIFYDYVCPAKNTSNSAFCVGTNMIFRRSAIDDIGGIAQLTHSEDIWTSLHLHEKQWSTIFVADVLVEGLAPEEIIPYFKQQTRWASGGFSMLFTHNPLTSTKLSLDQKMQYFFSNTFFFVGFTILVYIINPIIFLLFGIKPLEAQSTFVWFTHYLPYVVFYYSLTWMLLGRIKISSMAVSTASFYPYLKALVTTFLNIDQTWHATTASKQASASNAIMQWIWPHVLLIFLSIFSLIIGWIAVDNLSATLVYTVLVTWNLYLLSIFVTGNNREVAV